MIISPAIIFGFLSGAATLAGIYAVLANESFAKRNLVGLLSFSAGVLLSFSLSDLIPEAQNLQPDALVYVLASFFVFYVLEHSLIWHSHKPNEEREIHIFGLISILSLGFHSLIDGIVIAAGFAVSEQLGFVATMAVILHEFPEGVSSISVMLHAGYDKGRALLFSWMVALATPVGALLVVVFRASLPKELLGILLALAAGSFLYVAAADLIPEIHKKSQLGNIALVLIGILVPFAVHNFFGA